jgi:long-chain fatty acid transport protein
VRAAAWAPWLAVAVLLADPRVASASPEDLFGFGPRSAAMGTTGAAAANGWEATYANPALLSRVRRKALTLGLQGAVFDLHADGAALPGRVSAVPAKSVLVGAEVPVPLGGMLRDRLALGMAFLTPSDTLVRARIAYPEAAQFPLLGDRSQSLAARIGGGIDAGYGVRIGAGVAVLAQLVGSIEIATGAGAATSRVDDQLVATYAPTVGAAWEPPLEAGPHAARPWRIGATWRGALQARFDVAVDVSTLSTLSLPPLHIGGVAQYDPEELSAEIARERDAWTFAVGVTWKRWSAYPGPFEPTVVCGAGESCSALAPPSVPLSDTLVPRVGVEHALELARHASLRLRAGFLLEPTPVPSSLPSSQAYDARTQALADVPTRFFDSTRAVLTAGWGADLGDFAPLAVDVFAQWHWLAPRDVETPPAAPARLSGSVLAWGVASAVRF